MTSGRQLVRIVTAGSVDDGKSTLIGRLLYDSHAIPRDQYEAVERASRATGEERTNLALLTDGLRAERDAKITIDVAHRYFRTPRRQFILADAPGHPQYTRNMVTAASNADVALLLVDIQNGLTQQSKRHAFIASLLRVPNVLVVVNKLDLIGYDRSRFAELEEQFRSYAAYLDYATLRFVPVSALEGDNVVARSTVMPWYSGPTVLEYLEEIDVRGRRNRLDFRFPVQCVLRPHRRFRGYAGQASSGSIRLGEEVMVLPAGITTRVCGLADASGEVTEATCDSPAIVELEDDLDVGRGDMLVRPRNPATVTSRLEAMVCWMGTTPSGKGSYRMLHTTNEVACSVEEIVYRLDVETLHRRQADSLQVNDIARVVLRTGAPICADLYEHNRLTGSFVLVDPDTNQTVAAGVVVRTYDSRDRSAFLPQLEAGSVVGHPGVVLWLTGMSGAGKSTLSDLLKSALADRGIAAIQLDGDALREGVCRDLAFGETDRNENIRRAAEIAKLISNQGFVVLCSFISPLEAQRALARQTVGETFLEVFVECPLDELKRRDPKGLYARAARGEIRQFTGISAPYEAPATPEIRVNTHDLSPSEALSRVLDGLLQKLGGVDDPRG